MAIDRPSSELVARNERTFDARDDAYDAAVRLVFERWPNNTNDAEVLVKVVVPNRLYGTNIYSVGPVAARIKELNIDQRLQDEDASVVDDIADIKFPDRSRRCVSFASKYCAWHQPDAFPMFDSYVERRLWKYQKAFGFSKKFRRDELSRYRRYRDILDDFQRFFGLSSCSRRQIDKFLWIAEAEASGELDMNDRREG